MCATKRSGPSVPLMRPANPSRADHLVAVALRELKVGFQAIAETLLGESQHQEQQEHSIVAAILRHMAERLGSANTPDQFEPALNEIAELTNWLPVEPRSRLEQNGLAIAAIVQQHFDADTHKDLMALLQRPGRPGSSRGAAAWALELREHGQKWPEIEERLLPHRRHVKNPGESIRREVQLLKSTLRRYGVPFEGG